MDKPSPVFDIIGPTVADDIRRLMARYGVKAINDAVKQQTARRRGRLPEKDWQALADMLREDALLWLAGADPFKSRSNRKMALHLVNQNPGQSDESTYRRIMGKLSARRRYYTMVEAEWLSQSDHPYSQNLRAIKALIEIGVKRDLWEGLLRLNEGALADYTRKFGEPSANATMQELHAEAAKPMVEKIQAGTGNILQILLGNQLK